MLASVAGRPVGGSRRRVRRNVAPSRPVPPCPNGAGLLPAARRPVRCPAAWAVPASSAAAA